MLANAFLQPVYAENERHQADLSPSCVDEVLPLAVTTMWFAYHLVRKSPLTAALVLGQSRECIDQLRTNLNGGRAKQFTRIQPVLHSNSMCGPENSGVAVPRLARVVRGLLHSASGYAVQPEWDDIGQWREDQECRTALNTLASEREHIWNLNRESRATLRRVATRSTDHAMALFGVEEADIIRYSRLDEASSTRLEFLPASISPAATRAASTRRKAAHLASLLRDQNAFSQPLAASAEAERSRSATVPWDDMERIEKAQRGVELTKLGFKPTIIEAEIGSQLRLLRGIYRVVTGKTAHGSTGGLAWALRKNIAMRREASLYILVYLNGIGAASRALPQTNIDHVSLAYQRYRDIRDETELTEKEPFHQPLSRNVAYVITKELKQGSVTLRHCRDCDAAFAEQPSAVGLQNCPYCKVAAKPRSE
jgi:hypothetical protein